MNLPHVSRPCVAVRSCSRPCWRRSYLVTEVKNVFTNGYKKMPQGLTLANLSSHLHIDTSWLTSYGMSESMHSNRHVVRIPYFNREGKEVSSKLLTGIEPRLTYICTSDSRVLAGEL